jgi:NadR type nicotinamide-nucleotide adenylyltransferase
VTAGFAHGLIIGKFYPPHAGHRFLIRAAAASCTRVSVVVMAADVESIPLERRVAWLREAFDDAPHVSVVGVVDNLEVDYDSDDAWAGHVGLMRAAIASADSAHRAVPVDAVFTSEAYGAELARRFDAADVRLDPARATFAVSGTAVRNDPVAHWALLDPPVRAWLARRVVVLGAESTGTTTLSRDLAAALRACGGAHGLTAWVPEYGRELTVIKLAVAQAMANATGTPAPSVFDLEWHDSDFLDVALRQTADEDRTAREGGPVLVCDTDALATTVWQERYMGAATPEVLAAAGAGKAADAAASPMPPRALYLLTAHEDVPFEDDGLRDGEHIRAWMTQRFREVLAAQDVPWVEVRGDRAARLAQALAAVDALLAAGSGLADPMEQRGVRRNDPPPRRV